MPTKHAGQCETVAWHELVGKYKAAVRYLQQQDLPAPHADILKKKSRDVMTRYINKAEDARLSGTMFGHLVNEQGGALTRVQQRQLRGRLTTRAASSALQRASMMRK